MGEDRAHFDVASTLIDKRLRERVAWVRDEDAKLEWAREWLLGQYDRGWHRREHLAEGVRLQPRRGDSDEYLAVRKTLVALEERGVELAVVARDLDRVEGREDDHHRAIRAAEELRGAPLPFAVVLALPEPETEAWHLALVRDDEVRARAAAMKLGFDPCREPHRLTSTASGHPADAKTVSDELLGVGDRRALLDGCEWAQLTAESARGCGLSAFAEAVDAALERLFDTDR